MNDTVKHSCYLCGTVYPGSVRFCSVCMQANTMLPVPEGSGKVYFQRGDRKGVVSVSQIRSQELTGREIKGYEYLGHLPNTWRGLIYGKAGSGKSTFALNFIMAYGRKSLYVSAEEGVTSETIKRRIVANEITGDIYFTDSKLKWEIEEDFKKVDPSLIIIDSIQALGDEAIDFRLDCGQLWVCHSNKDSTFKGDSSIAHYVDLVMKMDEGSLFVEKNRFGSSNISVKIWE